MVTVNAMGDTCPIPVVKTLNAIRELKNPDLVETLVDNEIAVQNLTRMANQKGHAVKSEKLAEKQFKVTITVGSVDAAADVETGEVVCVLPSNAKKNTEVVKKLKAAGVGVYYLSNTNAHAFEFMTSTYEVFKFMDGGIASYLDGVLKPSADIFKLFLSRYGKIAEECVFVDDVATNVNGARAVGLNGIILKNIDDLEDELCKYPELRTILKQ